VSKNFSTYTRFTYNGTYFKIPISGVADTNEQPGIVPVNVNWTDYAIAGSTKIGVNVNLNQSSSGSVISRCLACFIDNTQSNSAVYVVFPDTGYTMRVEALSQRMCPVVSQSLTPTVYIENVTANSNTTFFFANINAAEFHLASAGGSLIGLQASGGGIVPGLAADAIIEGLAIPGVNGTFTGGAAVPLALSGSYSNFVVKSVNAGIACLCTSGLAARMQFFLAGGPVAGTYPIPICASQLWVPSDTSAMQRQLVFDLSDLYITVPTSDSIFIVINGPAFQAGAKTFFQADATISGTYE
jgi:hypothetical protein